MAKKKTKKVTKKAKKKVGKRKVKTRPVRKASKKKAMRRKSRPVRKVAKKKAMRRKVKARPKKTVKKSTIERLRKKASAKKASAKKTQPSKRFQSESRVRPTSVKGERTKSSSKPSESRRNIETWRKEFQKKNGRLPTTAEIKREYRRMLSERAVTRPGGRSGSRSGSRSGGRIRPPSVKGESTTIDPNKGRYRPPKTKGERFDPRKRPTGRETGKALVKYRGGVPAKYQKPVVAAAKKASASPAAAKNLWERAKGRKGKLGLILSALGLGAVGYNAFRKRMKKIAESPGETTGGQRVDQTLSGPIQSVQEKSAGEGDRTTRTKRPSRSLIKGSKRPQPRPSKSSSKLHSDRVVVGRKEYDRIRKARMALPTVVPKKSGSRRGMTGEEVAIATFATAIAGHVPGLYKTADQISGFLGKNLKPLGMAGISAGIVYLIANYLASRRKGTSSAVGKGLVKAKKFISSGSKAKVGEEDRVRSPRARPVKKALHKGGSATRAKALRRDRIRGETPRKKVPKMFVEKKSRFDEMKKQPSLLKKKKKTFKKGEIYRRPWSGV